MMLALGVAGAACPHVAGVTLTYAGVTARLAGPRRIRVGRVNIAGPLAFCRLRYCDRAVGASRCPKSAPDGAPRKKDLLVATFKAPSRVPINSGNHPWSRRVRIPLGAFRGSNPSQNGLVEPVRGVIGVGSDRILPPRCPSRPFARPGDERPAVGYARSRPSGPGKDGTG